MTVLPTLAPCVHSSKYKHTPSTPDFRGHRIACTCALPDKNPTQQLSKQNQATTITHSHNAMSVLPYMACMRTTISSCLYSAQTKMHKQRQHKQRSVENIFLYESCYSCSLHTLSVLQAYHNMITYVRPGNTDPVYLQDPGP